MKFLHLIGSSMAVVLLSFILVDLKYARQISSKAVLGNIVAVVLLFIILLRT